MATNSAALLEGGLRELAQAGLGTAERRLFEELYQHHFDFVFRCAVRAGVPDASVDDAVQDVFLVVLRRLSQYSRGTNPRTWLYAIVSRVASNHRRRDRRKGGLDPLSPDQLASAPGPFEGAAHADDLRLLHRFLASLDGDKRDVFIMMDLEQMTGREVAEALDLNLNTVFSRLRIARQKLSNYLTQHRADGA